MATKDPAKGKKVKKLQIKKQTLRDLDAKAGKKVRGGNPPREASAMIGGKC